MMNELVWDKALHKSMNKVVEPSHNKMGKPTIDHKLVLKQKRPLKKYETVSFF